jgi:hypothetical protein
LQEHGDHKIERPLWEALRQIVSLKVNAGFYASGRGGQSRSLKGCLGDIDPGYSPSLLSKPNRIVATGAAQLQGTSFWTPFNEVR